MESTPKLESPAEALVHQLDSIPWEDQYEFVYNFLNFKLHISTKEEISQDPDSYGDPADYAGSTETEGYDIYLHDTIPEADRKRALFHEVFEAYLVSIGNETKHAHELTIIEEDKIFGKRQ